MSSDEETFSDSDEEVNPVRPKRRRWPKPFGGKSKPAVVAEGEEGEDAVEGAPGEKVEQGFSVVRRPRPRPSPAQSSSRTGEEATPPVTPGVAQ
jgi:hypothetical protein